MGSEGNAAHIIMSGCKRVDMSVPNNAYAFLESSASELTRSRVDVLPSHSHSFPPNPNPFQNMGVTTPQPPGLTPMGRCDDALTCKSCIYRSEML
jgi:hypothetical protein